MTRRFSFRRATDARQRSSSVRAAPRIVDLQAQHKESYFVCLEGWSSELSEAGEHKARWYDKMKDQGLRVKLALNEDDQPVGMIHYLPIEVSPADGEDLYMILCVWVHGHSEGVGNKQGHGVGMALLQAAEADARLLGAKGMVTWGLHIPVWMKSAWYKEHGYVTADRNGIRELVWKPFTADAVAPSWIPEQSLLESEPGKVNFVAFQTGWCPAMNLTYERSRRVASEFGTEVAFNTIDTTDRATLRRYGRSDEVRLNGKPVQRGAPPSTNAIRRRVRRQLRTQRRKSSTPVS